MKQQDTATGLQDGATQHNWQRIIVLLVLGYEALGCLAGGAMLMAAPDGSSMQMPVTIMNGVFRDFLIPGIILFMLGIINTVAFYTVLRRTPADRIMAQVALGGLIIWFITEIIILEELHWLHAMWGLPVLAGYIFSIPLLAARRDKSKIRRKLLSYGLLAALYYVSVTIIVSALDTDYAPAEMTISELSAIGSATRTLWVLLCTPFPLLVAAFGWGLMLTRPNKKALHSTGTLMVVFALFNLYWPPMHQRNVIAAGGAGLTDALHLTWTIFTVMLMVLIMGFGAAAMKKWFRIFTVVVFAAILLSGFFIASGTTAMHDGLPTPGLGLWERVSIYAFMLWIGVLSIALLQRKETTVVHQAQPQ